MRPHTLIFTPRRAAGKLPFLLQRAPYGLAYFQAFEQQDYFRDLVAEVIKVIDVYLARCQQLVAADVRRARFRRSLRQRG